MRCAFIQDKQHIWPIRGLCSTLDVHYSGYYAWLKQPIRTTAKKRQQLLGLIKQFWLKPGGVYGYRKIHCDLKREVCEHVLSHKLSDEVEAAYLRGAYLEKRKNLMADWAEYCYQSVAQ